MNKNFLIDKKSENVYFLPLGGSGEIGMNLNLYGYQNKWLIIDCGISVRDSNIIGADVFMPNIDSLIIFPTAAVYFNLIFPNSQLLFFSKIAERNVAEIPTNKGITILLPKYMTPEI